jgi:predicted DNA-binding transcriptional regulator AlpA
MQDKNSRRQSSQPKSPRECFLTGPKIDARYGISAMTRWRWQRDSRLGFPAPMKINGRKLWRLSDLEFWERSRMSPGEETGPSPNEE